MTDRPGTPRIPRGLEFGLFVTAMIWAAAAHAIAGRAASGIAVRFGLVYGQDLLYSLFLLFLVIVGFRMLDFVATRSAGHAEIVPLPRRSTASSEWGTGVAIGWGLCLAAVLPVLLAGRLHAQFNRGPGVLPGIVTAVLTLLVLSLAEEVIFRGYPFRRLAQSLSTVWASVFLSLIFALVLIGMNLPLNVGAAILDGMLLGLLLSMAYLRTHALWLGWGLHFGYRVVMAVVLGLPITGRSDGGALLDASVGPPRWLSGGGFGLDAALLTSVMLLIAMAVLYRASRPWAWAYTTPEFVGAGYEVVIAPPAAHVAMEKAAAPPPLVQILPSTPQTFSVTESTVPKD